MDPRFQNVVYGTKEFYCTMDELMKYGISLEPEPGKQGFVG